MDKPFFEQHRPSKSIPPIALKSYASCQHLLELYKDIALVLSRVKSASACHDGSLAATSIKQAIDLLNEVRYSVQSPMTAEFPYNIDHLYEHIQKSLLEYHLHKNDNSLDEVIEIMAIMQSGLEAVTQSFFDKSEK